ncbi:hypothetical protein [Phaffia rhodozyma]|uniref:Uncharacterized protein n=1 Tax=Phaffia rhodozyma TaxID=264483 RepID=A0A0F7SNZ8_PHARH|nr:hypothetical protein [Phaffia rhodozyma]
MPPRTGLSGNTLSLKFMNRGNPSSASVAKPSATAASFSSSKPSTSKSITNNSTDGEWFIPGWEDSSPAPATGSSSSETQKANEDKIEVEDSYLPFLLEKDTGGRRLGNGGAEVVKEDIGGKGGRRSFGGINKSIEKLSQPVNTSVAIPETSSSNTSTPPSAVSTSQTPSTETQTGFLRPSGFASPPSKRKIEKSVLSHLQSSSGARSTAPSSANSSRSSTPASSSGMKRFPPLSKKKRKSDTISSSASESDGDEEEEEELQMLYDSVAPTGARGSKGKPRAGGISSGGGARKPQGHGKRSKKNGGSA